MKCICPRYKNYQSDWKYSNSNIYHENVMSIVNLVKKDDILGLFPQCGKDARSLTTTKFGLHTKETTRLCHLSACNEIHNSFVRNYHTSDNILENGNNCAHDLSSNVLYKIEAKTCMCYRYAWCTAGTGF